VVGSTGWKLSSSPRAKTTLFTTAVAVVVVVVAEPPQAVSSRATSRLTTTHKYLAFIFLLRLFRTGDVIIAIVFCKGMQ